MELAPALTISDYTTGSVLFTPASVTYEITLPAAYNGPLAYVRDAGLDETIITRVHRDLRGSPFFEGAFLLEIDHNILFTIDGGDVTPEALHLVADTLIEHLNNIEIPASVV